MNERALKAIKLTAFVLLATPFAYFWWQAWAHTLGPNPVEAALHRSGDWALRILLLTLGLPLIRQMTNVPWLLRLRRMVGLFAFFYVLVHVGVYAILDRGLDMDEIVKDVLKRPYITLGVTAALVLLPLAATSTDAMVRWLREKWKSLHRWVYVAATLAILHNILAMKADIRTPLIHAAILLALLVTRAIAERRRVAASVTRASGSGVA